MRATRANLLGEFIGRLDNLIYYRRQPGGRIFVRKQFSFKNHPAQAGFASAQRAIYALNPSEGYKRDIKDYLPQYKQLPQNKDSRVETWTNLYNKLMFALQKKLPGQVLLAEITREQIITQNLPCQTLKDAVEAELLPVVTGYEKFTRPI